MMIGNILEFILFAIVFVLWFPVQPTTRKFLIYAFGVILLLWLLAMLGVLGGGSGLHFRTG